MYVNSILNEVEKRLAPDETGKLVQISKDGLEHLLHNIDCSYIKQTDKNEKIVKAVSAGLPDLLKAIEQLNSVLDDGLRQLAKDIFKADDPWDDRATDIGLIHVTHPFPPPQEPGTDRVK